MKVTVNYLEKAYECNLYPANDLVSIFGEGFWTGSSYLKGSYVRGWDNNVIERISNTALDNGGSFNGWEIVNEGFLFEDIKKNTYFIQLDDIGDEDENGFGDEMLVEEVLAKNPNLRYYNREDYHVSNPELFYAFNRAINYNKAHIDALRSISKMFVLGNNYNNGNLVDKAEYSSKGWYNSCVEQLISKGCVDLYAKTKGWRRQATINVVEKLKDTGYKIEFTPSYQEDDTLYYDHWKIDQF